MKTTQKPWEELTFKDHFVFERVMENPKLCRWFLFLVLKRDIEPLTFPPQTETIIDTHYDAKSIRLDVIAHEANGAVHDIELQNTETDPLYLGLRVRYYESTIDQELLRKGEKYKCLAEVSIIFVCDYDPYGEGFRRYTFRKRCDEKLSLVMPNRTVEIFLNIHGTIGEESPEIVAMFDYLATGRVQGDFVSALDAEVQKIKADENQRSSYMSLATYIEDIQDDSYAEGKNDGYNLGKDDGYNLGKDDGIAEGIRAVAQRMLRLDMSLEQVALATGLTEAQLRQMQQQA